MTNSIDSSAGASGKKTKERDTQRGDQTKTVGYLPKASGTCKARV